MIALLLLAVVSANDSSDLGPHSNPIRNGSFESAGARGVAGGWAHSGPGHAGLDSAVRCDGRVAQRFQGLTRKQTVLWQDVRVDPGTTWLFRAWVKSDGRVVAQVGKCHAAYHRQGEWQQLVALARPELDGSLQIRFLMASLTDDPATIWLDNASLMPVQRPEHAPSRRGRFGITHLTKDGQSLACVVYPSKGKHWIKLAERVGDHVEQVTGARPRVISDVQATGDGPPVLKAEYRNRPLILIGRLGVNRAMWPAYNRFLCAVDGYYPGGDGYVVRTAANVFGDGHNHLILGGSTDRGAERAVDRFVELLPGTDVPWLLDVQLGGDCLTAFQEYDQRWATDPYSVIPPPIGPGYQTVRQWYENAQGYYWSGWESFRKRMQKYLDTVLKDQAYTHHYLAEFLVRTHNMLAESEVLSGAQRDALDSLVTQNFWDFTLGPDLSWMTVFSPPYDAIRLTNRHSIAPWLADLTMADFLDEHFVLAGDLADIVAFRRSEKHAFFRHWVSRRWSPSPPAAANGTGCHEEIVAAMFRYALEHEMYTLFDSGHAHRALHLDFTDHHTGSLTRPSDGQDLPLLLGILAHYHEDGRYVRLLRTLPSRASRSPFQGRYVCGVHRYAPGPELAEASLDSLVGMRLPEFSPHQERNLVHFGGRRFRKPTVDASEACNFVAFRSGFDADDDYLAVSGVAAACSPGSILTFASHRTQWLSRQATSVVSDQNPSYFDQNAVYVVQVDRLSDDAQPYASVARSDYTARWQSGGAVGFTLEPFAGTRWQREIAWLEAGLYLVRDTVTPVGPGQYQMMVNWHPAGRGSWDGRAWTSNLGSGRLRITPIGKGFRLVVDESGGTHVRFMATNTLTAGESRTIHSVLQSYRGGTAWNAGVDQQANIWLTSERDAARAIRVQWPTGQPPRVAYRNDTPGSLSVPSVESAVTGVSATDGTSSWQTAWTYDGLQRPARVAVVRNLPDDIVDLGRVVDLAEIRAVHRIGGPWQPSKLPDKVWTALPDATGAIPPVDSDAWHRVTSPLTWRPGTRTSNYGGAHPVDAEAQMLSFDKRHVRFVRGKGAGRWFYFAGDKKAARRPLVLDVQDVDRDGVPELLVKPRIFKKFIRAAREEDDALALVGADGVERFQYEPARCIQDAVLLDYLGDGTRKVATVGRAGMLRVFDSDGTVLRQLDLYQAHQQFNRQHGRSNTRHPAGGLVMPYAVGAWRGEAGNPARLVVARYGAFSFVDDEGQFKGVLKVSGYVNPALLPNGVDFDGDGHQEQLALGRGRVIQLCGEGTPYISDPLGALFYPQVYDYRTLAEPAYSDALEGGQVFVFDPLPWGNQARYVAIVRTAYAGIYDAAKNKWAFTWVPSVRIAAAVVTEAAEDSLAIAAVTKDGFLWRLTWTGRLADPPDGAASPLGCDVQQLAASPSGNGDLLIAGCDGVYLLPEAGPLQRIAEGAYTDSQFLGDRAIVVATADGRILRLNSAPAPNGQD
ncbi:MAG: hypothetical protein ACC628_14125 [Pirellulaceae bacterium]